MRFLRSRRGFKGYKSYGRYKTRVMKFMRPLIRKRRAKLRGR